MTLVQFLRTETFPRGGEVVGILDAVTELSWELAWYRGSIGTSEPDLARTSCYYLGPITLRVPISCLARTRGLSLD